jgi:hypothetical protein
VRCMRKTIAEGQLFGLKGVRPERKSRSRVLGVKPSLTLVTPIRWGLKDLRPKT